MTILVYDTLVFQNLNKHSIYIELITGNLYTFFYKVECLLLMEHLLDGRRGQTFNAVFIIDHFTIKHSPWSVTLLSITKCLLLWTFCATGIILTKWWCFGLKNVAHHHTCYNPPHGACITPNDTAEGGQRTKIKMAIIYWFYQRF